MSKKESCLACPSCKDFKLALKDNKFFCNKCDLFYKIKDGYPILINFNLENVLIKEDEIKIKKKDIQINKLKIDVLNFFYGVSKVTQTNVFNFLNRLTSRDSKKILVIGGATRGSGTDGLWDNNQLEITSVDLVGTENVDFIVDAHYLPFKNETFDGVWIQAVLEHVVSPEMVVKEIFRVLKKNGYVYSEIPFMQQIHMGKNDFTRYTASGHRFLFKNFEKISVGTNGGPGTSLSWSLKYFIWSFTNEKIANILTIIPFFIFRLFDKFLSEKVSWNGPSGFYFLGKKNINYKFDKEELNQIYKGRQI
jgi:ubiquinone/menaquinone biosynthesis C-methylase UbiE/uncharacterized protein YbaR (Trm112 family)